MKKTIKKIACAALCAVLLFCMAAPAFALSGSNQVDVNLTYIGVRARCTSTVNVIKAKGTLTLSYLPAYSSNHLPENDYACQVILDIYGTSDYHLQLVPNAMTGMSSSTTYSFSDLPSGITETSVKYTYKVNGSQVHFIELP